MITLYGHKMSGNVYKVRLLLELLGVEYEFVKVDLMKGEHKKPPYLAINPFGQVPALVDGDNTILDAQAILIYLAQTYGDENWLPTGAIALSRVVRWLSTTAGEVRQGPESARLYYLFKLSAINIERATEKSHLILQQLDNQLADQDWLEFGHVSIADIAVFPYVVLAPDGKVSLDAYPNVLAWIERIRHLPNFVGMPGIDAPNAA